MSKKRPGGYGIQDGCHNCVFAFTKYEYEDGPTQFCTFNAPERPPCGSVAMDETWPLGEDAAFSSAMRKWEKWSRGRECHPAGICDVHKRRTEREGR